MLLCTNCRWTFNEPSIGKIKVTYMSCTECKICTVVAMCSTSVLLLPQCTWAPTERHSSPVEAVLRGSGAALPGLVEIPRSPWGTRRIQSTGTQNCLKWLPNPRQGPPRLPDDPPDTTPSPAYLGMSLRLEPTTTLFTLYYNTAFFFFFFFFTNLQMYRSEDGVALMPHWLRVPPPLTPTHAPQQQSLMVTPAPAGSNAQGTSHQLWR